MTDDLFKKKQLTVFIAEDVKLGNNVVFYGFANIYGCNIDDNTRIGTFVEIQRDVRIGKNCKISSHSFICEGVSIEDECFIGHGVIFINDRFPRATNSSGSLKSGGDWKLEPTIVKKGVSIGSGAVIMCGITIGEYALIGAGAVVTKDVPSNAIVTGCPARLMREIDQNK